jgi:hypothetical protein
VNNNNVVTPVNNNNNRPVNNNNVVTPVNNNNNNNSNNNNNNNNNFNSIPKFKSPPDNHLIYKMIKNEKGSLMKTSSSTYFKPKKGI